MMSSNGVPRLGEVIETSTVGFTAQGEDLFTLPPLGSLVRVALAEGPTAPEAYAVVAFGETAGIDAGRRAVRRGSDEVHDHDIYREHPELAYILRTTFRAVTVGYSESGRLHRYLPPTPPPLHFSVRAVSPPAVVAFTDNLLYLRMLLMPDERISPEQLLAAHIRAVFAARGEDQRWLEAAGREVARLFKDDYDRLLTVLQSIEPTTEPSAVGR
jgi:hypothetical protein